VTWCLHPVALAEKLWTVGSNWDCYCWCTRQPSCTCLLLSSEFNYSVCSRGRESWTSKKKFYGCVSFRIEHCRALLMSHQSNTSTAEDHLWRAIGLYSGPGGHRQCASRLWEHSLLKRRKEKSVACAIKFDMCQGLRSRVVAFHTAPSVSEYLTFWILTWLLTSFINKIKIIFMLSIMWFIT
jgi:hypothetical protein